MKIRVMGVEVYNADGQMEGWTDRWTDGQTDTTKLTVFFSQFRESAYKVKRYQQNQGNLHYLKIIQKITQKHTWEELYKGIH